MDIYKIKGDILESDVDVIVNPTNRWMIAGGGLCGQIYRAAGKKDLEDYTKNTCFEEYSGDAPVGSCILSPTFNLRQQYIIHIVTPKYHLDPVELLETCYKAVLQKAESARCKSLALPLLGTGINGIPTEVSLDYLKSALDRHKDTNLTRVDIYISKMS